MAGTQSMDPERKKKKPMRTGERRLKFRTYSDSALVEVSSLTVLRRKDSPGLW